MNNAATDAGDSRYRALVAIKLMHTVVWAFLVGCIVALPFAGGLGRFRLAAVLTAVILIECLVLVLNGWRCPLTDVAARYTDDRRDNFDICLPLLLARYNKLIFGWLFAAVLLWALVLWLWR